MLVVYLQLLSLGGDLQMETQAKVYSSCDVQRGRRGLVAICLSVGAGRHHFQGDTRTHHHSAGGPRVWSWQGVCEAIGKVVYASHHPTHVHARCIHSMILADSYTVLDTHTATDTLGHILRNRVDETTGSIDVFVTGSQGESNDAVNLRKKLNANCRDRRQIISAKRTGKTKQLIVVDNRSLHYLVFIFLYPSSISDRDFMNTQTLHNKNIMS